MVPASRRGTAYGLFNTIYGMFWFGGSALMGLLYDVSIAYLILFGMAAQTASLPFLFMIREDSSTDAVER